MEVFFVFEEEEYQDWYQYQVDYDVYYYWQVGQ